MKKVGGASLLAGIQEGFTEEVTFRKLSKLEKHAKANRLTHMGKGWERGGHGLGSRAFSSTF